MKVLMKYKMFIFYFLLGILNALALSAYPLIYIDKGFSNEVVAMLISISFLAMILQPLVGIFTDKLGDNIKALKIILIVYMVSSIMMFFSIKLFIIGLILNSITRNSIGPIADGYVTKTIHQFDYSYAQMRTAMPIGFGTSFLLSLLFTTVLGLPISGILVFLAILGLLIYIIIGSLDRNAKYENSSGVSTEVLETNIKHVVLLVLYFLLYAGIYQVSSSYLSLYMVEHGRSELFIGVLNFLMVIPQIVLLFNYNKLFGKVKQSSVMAIATCLGVVQALIYVFIPQSAVMLVIASFLSGIQIVLFPSGFYPQFTKAVKSSKLATYMTLNTSVQAVWVGVFNQFFVAKVYGMTGTTTSVYIIVITMMIIGLIPVLVFKRVSGE